MAPKTSFMRSLLPFALLVFLYVITAPANADYSFDINSIPSPEASTSLICPNDNPTDCYPTLFQPTVYFQKIRPNQSLPPGLHVRLNIQTGEKEARLNVPDGAEEDNADAIIIVDDLPHTSDTAMGIVNEEERPLHLRLQDVQKQAKHARPYTPPRPAAPVDANEAPLYKAALSTVGQKLLVSGANGVVYDTDMIDAFETLTELAHSIEWGLTICRNADLILPLLKYVFTTEAGFEPEVRSAALLLLGTAIQNNPDALNALISCYDDFEGSRVLLLKTMRALDADSFQLNQEPYPNIVAREIFFFSQLCAHEGVMQSYLTFYDGERREAFPSLLGLFSASHVHEVEGKFKIKHRIANFVEDHVEQVAIFHMAGHEDTDEIALEQLHVSLQPWCEVLHSDFQKYGKDGSFGFLQAKREVSRVLERYTGEGCVVTVDALGLKGTPPQDL